LRKVEIRLPEIPAEFIGDFALVEDVLDPTFGA
jgi:hypothetical protein